MRWLRRITERLAGAGGADIGRDERLRRTAFVLLVLLTCVAGLASGLLYWSLALPQVALVPFGYVGFALLSVAGFLASGRFAAFARVQLGLLLLLPFVVQWQMGGFVSAGAVMIWSITAPIGAFIFLGPRPGWLWFGTYLGLAAVSLGFEVIHRPPLPAPGSPVDSGTMATGLTLLNVLVASVVIFAVFAYTFAALRREQANAERLLLNILPAPIAERMRAGETAIADSYADVTILFADVVGFTHLAASLPAGDVVRLLDRIFTAFDEVVERCGVEKIKTIGDAYMVASGLPTERPDHAIAAAEVALAMRTAVQRIALEEGAALELRIGMQTGPAVAGVIGRRRFAYDVWGDTVNVASRLEAMAPPGGIRVGELTARALTPDYILLDRETVAVRGRGEMSTYLLHGRRT